MNYQSNKLLPLLFSFLFMSISYNVFASENSSTDIPISECMANLDANKHCTEYVKGYLAALQQLNGKDKTVQLSAFEQRAIRTRIGQAVQADPLREKFGICLPKELDNQDISNLLALSDKKVPADIALLKAIQAKYPC